MAEGSSNLRPGVAWTSNKALDAFQKTTAQSEQARSKKEAQEAKAKQASSKLAMQEASNLSGMIGSNIWEERDGDGIRSALDEGMADMEGLWEAYGKNDPVARKTLHRVKTNIAAMVNKSTQDKTRAGDMEKIALNNPMSIYPDELASLRASSTEFLSDVGVLNVRPDFNKLLDSHINQFISEQESTVKSTNIQDKTTGVTIYDKKVKAPEEARKLTVEDFLNKPLMRKEILYELGGAEGKSPEEKEAMIQEYAKKFIYPRTKVDQRVYSETGGVAPQDEIATFDMSNVKEQPVSYQFSQGGGEGEGAIKKGSVSGIRLHGVPFIEVQSGTSGNRWDMANGLLISETHGDKGQVVDYIRLKVGSNGTPDVSGAEERVFVMVKYGGANGHTELTEIGNIENQLPDNYKGLIGGKPKIKVSDADVDAKLKQYGNL